MMMIMMMTMKQTETMMMFSFSKIIEKIVSGQSVTKDELVFILESSSYNWMDIKFLSLVATIKDIKECLIKNSVSKKLWPMWIKNGEYRESAYNYCCDIEDVLYNRVLDSPIRKKLENTIVSLYESRVHALKHAEDIISKAIKFPFGKIVNDVLLSESCFAFVPDVKDPDSWAIQIVDSNGNFIESAELTKVISKVDCEFVKPIKERYSKAKAQSNKNDGQRVVVESTTIIGETIHGPDVSSGRLKITVIQPGLTLDGHHFYPRQVLAKAVEMYEGVKMFANHATDEEEWHRPERSINDWVAVLENPHLGEGGEILADAVIIAPEFKEKIELMDSQGKLNSLGVSHSIFGDFEFETMGENDVMIITDIIGVRSVDFVTQGNAGGATHVLESYENDVDLISATRLAECRPDLIKKLEESWIKKIKESSMDYEKEVKRLQEELAKVNESNTIAISELTAKLDEALSKLKENEDNTNKDKTQAEIKVLVSESDLPDNAKKLVTDNFKESVDFASIKENLEAQIETLISIKEGAKVKGNGRSGNDENSENDEEAEKGRTSLIEAYTKTFEHKGFSSVEAKEKAEARYSAR